MSDDAGDSCTIMLKTTDNGDDISSNSQDTDTFALTFTILNPPRSPRLLFSSPSQCEFAILN